MFRIHVVHYLWCVNVCVNLCVNVVRAFWPTTNPKGVRRHCTCATYETINRAVDLVRLEKYDFFSISPADKTCMRARNTWTIRIPGTWYVGQFAHSPNVNGRRTAPSTFLFVSSVPAMWSSDYFAETVVAITIIIIVVGIYRVISRVSCEPWSRRR